MSVPSRRRIPLALAPAALVLLVLAGCGGGDEPASATTAATVTRTVTMTTPAPAPTTTTTRTSSAAPLTLHVAEDVLAARGYSVLGERDWRPDQTLKVLLGISQDDGPRAEQAFFFAGDAFIGTDTKDPSASIEVVAQQDDAIALAYGLYRPSDSIDAPTGGTAEVTYGWNGSRLAPQGPIPTASPGAPLSRR
jgi:hypothetical protein